MMLPLQSDHNVDVTEKLVTDLQMFNLPLVSAQR